MCVYLYVQNNCTQYTHIYYVNKNFYFGYDHWPALLFIYLFIYLFILKKMCCFLCSEWL